MLCVLRRKNTSGSVLIFTLWTVMLLTVFAAQIGLKIRQRAVLLSRIEDRSQLRFIAESGIKKGISALKSDLRKNNKLYTSYGKFYRHNNNQMFSKIDVGSGTFDVTYEYFLRPKTAPEKRFGIVDEESKLNINTANPVEMFILFMEVLDIDETRAKLLAEAIIDWRQIGRSQAEGFYSSDYYENLRYAYDTKNADFELIDELNLVDGFSQDIIDEIKPFITVYGDGRININTASPAVLKSMGLMDEVVDKIVQVRQGYDNKEATVDDFIFHKTYDIASEVASFVKLNEDEIRQIDTLNAAEKFKTNSSYFRINSVAGLSKRKGSLSVDCVYNLKENRIEYWREKI